MNTDKRENNNAAFEEYLFTVEDSFVISERGIVLAPGVPGDKSVRVGDMVELRSPDGSVFTSKIKGIEFSSNQNIPLLLSHLLSKEDIPAGTEVWLVQS
jgi:hypothetical protein